MDDRHRGNRVCKSRFHSHDAAGSPESRWLGAPIQTIKETVREASPLTYVFLAQAFPPFYLEAGDQDCSVPGEQTGELAAALNAAGAAVTHRVVVGAGHGMRFPAAQELPGVIRFFDDVLKRRPRRRPESGRPARTS
jgi:acetyl esterase/lipase